MSFKESLVALKDHTLAYRTVFVQVKPRPISALPILKAVLEHPARPIILYGSLGLGQQLIVYSDVAVRRAPNYYLLVLVLATAIRAIQLMAMN